MIGYFGKIESEIALICIYFAFEFSQKRKLLEKRAKCGGVGKTKTTHDFITRFCCHSPIFAQETHNTNTTKTNTNKDDDQPLFCSWRGCFGGVVHWDSGWSVDVNNGEGGRLVFFFLFSGVLMFPFFIFLVQFYYFLFCFVFSKEKENELFSSPSLKFPSPPSLLFSPPPPPQKATLGPLNLW